MPSLTGAEFGYCPRRLTLRSGDVEVTTLDTFDAAIEEVSSSVFVRGGWAYSPRWQNDTGGSRRDVLPRVRVFGLPKTHIVQVRGPTDAGLLDFLVWVLSFFLGMRLTTTRAGFVDATPVDLGKLVDFVWLHDRELEKALSLAVAFWQGDSPDRRQSKLWAAATHALFLSQQPGALQYERFSYGYTSIDACYALARLVFPGSGAKTHADRIAWMCEATGTPVPPWAEQVSASPLIATLRNATIHEGLFANEPLGFGIFRSEQTPNLTLEMANLSCRFLVALLGALDNDYVRVPVTTYQTQGLRL